MICPCFCTDNAVLLGNCSEHPESVSCKVQRLQPACGPAEEIAFVDKLHASYSLGTEDRAGEESEKCRDRLLLTSQARLSASLPSSLGL